MAGVLLPKSEREAATRPLTKEDVDRRVAEARAAQAAKPLPPLAAGDWQGIIRKINQIDARVSALENAGN